MPEITSYAPGTPSWVDLSTPDDKGALAFYSALIKWEFLWVLAFRVDPSRKRPILSNYLKTVRRQTRRYHSSPQASCNRPRKLDAFLS